VEVRYALLAQTDKLVFSGPMPTVSRTVVVIQLITGTLLVIRIGRTNGMQPLRPSTVRTTGTIN
jgi:hypothetical protein